MLHDLHPELGHASPGPYVESDHAVPGSELLGIAGGPIPPVSDHVIGSAAAGAGASASELAYGDALAPLYQPAVGTAELESEAAAAVGAAPVFKPPPRLAYGSRGAWVTSLQDALTGSGHPVVKDGVFGAKTHTAVLGFQRQRGLGSDGVVGKQTWGQLLGVDFAAMAGAAAGAAIGGLGAIGSTIGTALGTTGGAVTPSQPEGGLSVFVEHALRAALAVVDPAGADATIAMLKQLLASSGVDTAWLLAQIALELPVEGPYGPRWREAIARGILSPPPDTTHVIVSRVKFFTAQQAWPRAYAELDAHPMLDMLDALRMLTKAERTGLEQHLDPADPHAARVGPALHTATTHQAALVAGLDDATAIDSYAQLRQWPTVLDRAQRHGWQDGKPGTHIKPTGHKPGSGKPVIDAPDTGERLDDLDPTRQGIIELIRRNRTRLPEHEELAYTPDGKKGYMYRGKKDHKTPTDPPSASKWTPRQREVKNLVWAELDGEGYGSAINTWDDQVFSWGQGYAANSGLAEVMRILYAGGANAGIRNLLLDAGIHFDGTSWLVVNPDTGRIEVGKDALELLHYDRALLSLFINIAEDKVVGENGETNFGQALADARFTMVNRGGAAADVPDWAFDWDNRLIQFVAHCRHWGNPPWDAYSGVTDVRQALRICGWAHKMKAHLGGHSIGGLAGATLLGFAGGWLRSIGHRVAALPESGDHTGKVFLKEAKHYGGGWIVVQ